MAIWVCDAGARRDRPHVHFPAGAGDPVQLLHRLGVRHDLGGDRELLFVVHDPVFRTSLFNNLKLLATVPVMTALALLIALLLNDRIKGWRQYRAVVFLPNPAGSEPSGSTSHSCWSETAVSTPCCRTSGSASSCRIGWLHALGDTVDRRRRSAGSSWASAWSCSAPPCSRSRRDRGGGPNRRCELVDDPAPGRDPADPRDHRVLRHARSDHRALRCSRVTCSRQAARQTPRACSSTTYGSTASRRARPGSCRRWR